MKGEADVKCTYDSLTSAVNQDGCRLVEARVEVSLEWGNVLGEVNRLVKKRPNIDES